MVIRPVFQKPSGRLGGGDGEVAVVGAQRRGGEVVEFGVVGVADALRVGGGLPAPVVAAADGQVLEGVAEDDVAAATLVGVREGACLGGRGRADQGESQ